MSFNEIRKFIFENYYKRIKFSKGNRYYSKGNNKRTIFTMFDPNNANQFYQSFITKKTTTKKTKNKITTTTKKTPLNQ